MKLESTPTKVDQSNSSLVERVWVKEFAHFISILTEYMNTGKFYVTEVNESGSRKSTKTWSIEKLIILCCLHRPTSTYIFRKFNKDLTETIESLIDRLDAWSVVYTWHATKKLIVFPNGSQIKFKGLKTQNDKTTKLAGLAAAPKNHGIIEWFEEAFEFTDHDKTMARSAVRGGNGNKMLLTSCNPFLLSNFHIKYLHENLPFDKEVMDKKGNQYKVIHNEVVDKRTGEVFQEHKIFNYTNWKVNIYLRYDDVSQLEQIKNVSPQLANASYYGVPGSLGGLIFGEIMYHVKEPNWIPVEFVGGIDYGMAGSATTAGLWARDRSNQNLGKFWEYWHSNKEQEFLEATDQGVLIVKGYIELSKQFKQLTKGLVVYVDYSATGFISILKEKAQLLGCEWLDFRPSYKPDVLFAINWFYNVINGDRISMEGCSKTIEEYNTMCWDIKEDTDEVKPIKKWDHTFDSDKYAIFGAGWDQQVDFLRENKLLQKGYW